MFPYEAKILLVEDTEITRRIVHRMLGKLGYQNVIAVENGMAAWLELKKAAFTGRPYDLVLADWKMPVLSGIELLRKTRAHPALSTTPFVVLTTNIRREQVLEAISAGVNNYIAKPFVISVLEKKLQETWEALQRQPRPAGS